MTFWWASQSKNYSTAIPQGTLWSCPVQRADGTLSSRADRVRLREMQRDDVVFHYGDGYLRAVSRVTAPYVDARRPDGYPKIRGEDIDDGWLVRVEPIVAGLSVSFRELAPLISIGVGKPFGTDGRPAQKYISVLDPDEAAAILVLLSKALTSTIDAELLTGLLDEDGVIATDRPMTGTSRREQATLRRRLLRSHGADGCWLCGRKLPDGFLVAAHVMPRSMLTGEERLQLGHVAVLMCTLGCDALYERGFVIVHDGVVQAGRPAVGAHLAGAVAAVQGRKVVPGSDRQAELFAMNAARHVGELSPLRLRP